MTVAALLSRLERVKQTGPDRWRARCPAHDSKSLTLAVRALDSGGTVLHCFAGCSAQEVVAAAGLQMDALFPEKPAAAMFNGGGRPERRPFNAHDVLACIAMEAAIALQCANTLRSGEALSLEDHARLVVACGRLVAAEDIANG